MCTAFLYWVVFGRGFGLDWRIWRIGVPHSQWFYGEYLSCRWGFWDILWGIPFPVITWCWLFHPSDALLDRRVIRWRERSCQRRCRQRAEQGKHLKHHKHHMHSKQHGKASKNNCDHRIIVIVQNRGNRWHHGSFSNLPFWKFLLYSFVFFQEIKLKTRSYIHLIKLLVAGRQDLNVVVRGEATGGNRQNWADSEKEAWYRRQSGERQDFPKCCI